MPHEPFIIASYASAAVLMLVCALAPLLRMKRLRRAIRLQNREPEQERFNAPDA